MSSAQQRRPARPPGRPGSSFAPRPLSDADRDELQAILDRVPAPFEPLDVSMLDGFLCGVLVQPDRVPPPRWLPHVTDVDGRPLPTGFDVRRLEQLIERRCAELDDAIGRRQWFDPWIYELADAAEPAQGGAVNDPSAGGEDDPEEDDAVPPAGTEAVYPWVAGFATALGLFPKLLLQHDGPAVNGPLALLYRHLAPDDLEDADALLAMIDTLEPPADLTEAVEGLVRATLLLADVGRPIAMPAAPRRLKLPGRR